MIKLTIKNQDGSVKWKENFNRQIDADLWIKEEMTRPYWDVNNTVEMEDTGPADIAAAIAAKEEADAKEATRKNKRDSGIVKLKALGLTGAELKSLFKEEDIS